MRGIVLALLAGLVGGCGGAHGAVLPAAQSAPAAISAAAGEMDTLYPQSVSPASFNVAAMPQTKPLPVSALPDALRGLTPQSIGPLKWSKLSGSAIAVAGAPDGSLWALSPNPAGVNKSIWHYVSGTWNNISGSAASIAVGANGTLYAVNGTTGGTYAYNDSSWTSLGGGARWVTAGADGSVYVVSNAHVVNGNSAIWKYASGRWTQQAGSGSQLAGSFDPSTYTVSGVGTVAPNGYFAINTSGGIYYYSPGVGYVRFPGAASGIAPITGGVFALNYPPSGGGEGLEYFNYGSTGWAAEPGTGVSVAAAPGTQLYVANSARAIWTTPTTPTTTTGAFNDYVTFGYDNQRDVFNPNSSAITPAAIPNIHLAWQASLGGGDYNTQTQPVLATEISGHAGVLFVGGGTGNVYAYDALTGALLWTRNLGQETYSCENGNTIYFGVGGTVAYEPSSKSLYAIGNTNPYQNASAVNSLYHLDGASGSILGQVDFAPINSGWPSLDFSHTSVTLGNNGLAYVGTSATCDISSWRGRVAAVSVPAMTLASTFYTVWDPQNSRGGGAQPWGGGGIWGWGGVSLDFSGNVLTGVGNTDNGATENGTINAPFAPAPDEYSGLGETLSKISGDLSTLVDSNHPIPTPYSGHSVDLDLQGTPAVFQPNGTGCDPLAALQAKSGTLYIYDETRIGSGPIKQYQLAPSTYSDGFLGGPAYSPVTGLLYVGVSSSNESLYPPGMIAINPGCGSPSITWQTAFGPDSYAPGADTYPGVPRSVPAVSAGGVVFVGTSCAPSGSSCSATSSIASRSAQSAARKPLICCAPPGTGGGAVWAIDASSGTVLNGGNPLIITVAPLRVPPTIDGDWIFVLDNEGNFYGLTINPNYTAVQTKQHARSSRVLKSWESRPSCSTSSGGLLGVGRD